MIPSVGATDALVPIISPIYGIARGQGSVTCTTEHQRRPVIYPFSLPFSSSSLLHRGAWTPRGRVCPSQPAPHILCPSVRPGLAVVHCYHNSLCKLHQHRHPFFWASFQGALGRTCERHITRLHCCRHYFAFFPAFSCCLLFMTVL